MNTLPDDNKIIANISNPQMKGQYAVKPEIGEKRLKEVFTKTQKTPIQTYGRVVFLESVKNRVLKVFPGYDRSNLDPKVKPGDDFYKYSIGGYLAKHPIPPDKVRVGAFDMLREENEKKLREILEEGANKNAPLGSPEQKIRDFYASGMNINMIESFGIKPLASEFARINDIKTLKDLQEEIVHFHSLGINACFNFGSTQDIQEPNMVIGETFQGGIALPNRDYYINEEEGSRKIRLAYIKHLSKMFELMGDDAASSKIEAGKVMEIETRLAKASMANKELRDPYKTYNIFDKSRLAALTPNFSWDNYFKGIGYPDMEKINVATPGFFEEFNNSLTSVTLDDWKTYLRWQLINNYADTLSSSFVEENFNFKGRVLNGTEEMEPRWKKIVRYTDGALGEALGKEYVKKHFPPEAKARMLDMIGHIKSVLREKISNSDWMGDETKKEAIAKVDSLVVKVGYPDKWKDYSGLNIDGRDPFVVNVMKAAHFAVKEDLSRIGKPVDRSLWGMTPPTVNAYYNPPLNEMVFPAGILQPPFFDLDADDAPNYGGIGVVIGHELGHGFDDHGSQYDSTGKLRNWMQPEDKARFWKRVEGVKKQYSELEFDGSRVDGDNVCGEAMGDLGGVEVAYAALKKAAAGKDEPVTPDGFTMDQRFFLGFALIWATNMRKEYAHLLIKTDPHPLPEFRVNATLANISPFHKAFGLKEGEPMVRPEKDRNKLWNS